MYICLLVNKPVVRWLCSLSMKISLTRKFSHSSAEITNYSPSIQLNSEQWKFQDFDLSRTNNTLQQFRRLGKRKITKFKYHQTVTYRQQRPSQTEAQNRKLRRPKTRTFACEVISSCRLRPGYQTKIAPREQCRRTNQILEVRDVCRCDSFGITKDPRGFAFKPLTLHRLRENSIFSSK